MLIASRKKLLLLAVCWTLFLVHLLSRWSHWRALSASRGKFETINLHAQFWKTFKPVLDAYAPDCPSPQRSELAPSVRFNPNKEETRPDLLEMPESDVNKMRQKHAGFVEAIESLHPHYERGTRGLVTTAGGPYLPVLTISLRMLRRTGSKLPMEVFLASDEEYEPYICNVVFPKLNAKCIVMDHILKASADDVDIGAYQLKPFAMLFSSFEDILFLDADAFPIRDPSVLFSSDPFVTYRMVTWPDFWGSSTSKLYYQISSQAMPAMTARASTESGEILMSKPTHRKTLMLSTYYNYYGPSHYYALFSQGAAGEGDKETFLAAAAVVSESFYQVSEPIQALGHRSADGGMVGSAMVQYDPTEDYELTQNGLWRVKDPAVAPPPRPFFVHANVPKFNPATIFDAHIIDPVRDESGNYVRPWTIPDDVVEQLGEDVERQFWSEIKWVACNLESKFASWKGRTGICEHVKSYMKVVFGS
ncbi:hypothetical protein VTO42DRAFT_2149 [Malbranchea cinnamomea]